MLSFLTFAITTMTLLGIELVTFPSTKVIISQTPIQSIAYAILFCLIPAAGGVLTTEPLLPIILVLHPLHQSHRLHPLATPNQLIALYEH